MDLSQKLDYWTAIAATAFASATLVAVSAFWLHKRTIEQILGEVRSTKGLNNISDHSITPSIIDGVINNERFRSIKPEQHILRSHSSNRDRNWALLQREPSAVQTSMDSQCANTQRGSGKWQEQQGSTGIRTRQLGPQLNVLSAAIPPCLPRVQVDKEGITSKRNLHFFQTYSRTSMMYI